MSYNEELINEIESAIDTLETALSTAKDARDINEELEVEIEELEVEISELRFNEESQFPYSDLKDQMKVDLLKEYWDKITLDHLDKMVVGINEK